MYLMSRAEDIRLGCLQTAHSYAYRTTRKTVNHLSELPFAFESIACDIARSGGVRGPSALLPINLSPRETTFDAAAKMGALTILNLYILIILSVREQQRPARRRHADDLRRLGLSLLVLGPQHHQAG